MRITELGPGEDDRVVEAGGLFDRAPDPAATARFLAEPTHHLLLAEEDGAPAGFVTGVELTHPDKGTEMFLNELAVAERFRRRGIGRALVSALAELARERGCHGMWVLTDAADEGEQVAQATYRSAGSDNGTPATMLSWDV